MSDVKFFLQNGFKLLRVKPNSKMPADRHGVYSARDDWSDLELDGYNVGFAAGDGYIVLDVDPRNGGDVTLNKWIEEHGPIPQTWSVSTPSGGFHYYFRGECKNHTFGGVDLIGKGKYVLCPPSVVNEKPYEWINKPYETNIAEIPPWLLSLVENLGNKFIEEKDISSFDYNMDENNYDEHYIRNLLSFLSSDDRNDWIKIGMCLHSSQQKWAFELFKDWSKESKKYREGDCERVWKSFSIKPGGVSIGTLMHMAGEALKEVNEKYFGKFYLQKEEIKQITEEKKLLVMPEPKEGLLKDLYDYFYMASGTPHKSFAMAASFAVLSTITQRTFVGPTIASTPIYPNTYNMIIGSAACGKNDYIRTLMFRLFKSIDDLEPKSPTSILKLIIKDPASAQGLHQCLGDFPSGIFIRDEYIDKLSQSYSSKSTDQNAKNISDKLLELFNNVPMLSATSNKKKEDSMNAVMYPRLSILVAGVEDSFSNLLKTDFALSSGFVSRYDFWFEEKFTRNWKGLDEEDPNVRKSYLEKEAALLKDLAVRLKALWDSCLPKNFSVNSADKSFEPLVNKFKLDFESHALLKDYTMFTREMDLLGEQPENKKVSSIYRRVGERACKYALHQAIGCQRQFITKVDWEYAKELVKFQTETMISYYKFEGTSDKLHEIEDVVYNFFIKKKKELGKDVFILSDVARYIRPFKALDPNKRKEVLQGLEERDRIIIVPKSKRFRILDLEVEV